MLLFLQMDVHFWLLRAVGNSFRYVPPGTAHLSSLFTLAVLKTVGRSVRTRRSDRRAGAGGHARCGHHSWLAGQGVAANAADAAGARGQESSWHLILIATLKYWPDLFRRLFIDAVTNGERSLPFGRLRGTMADSNKTEKATPRQRQKARERGQVTRSRELSGALSMSAVAGVVYLMGRRRRSALDALLPHHA